ncbi:hypothetical protein BaRGS_00028478 [Batillaria attramentaria]|uniref:Uncharacterized protein n=1 Tax=Batillaria attramentaria TaxID=370345 RepID=A0ABD0K0F4_9CAEN
MAAVCFLVLAFSLTVHLSSGYHGHLYRRSDDTNPLSAVVAQQATDIQTNQAKIATLEQELAALKAQIRMYSISLPVSTAVFREDTETLP